MSEDEKTTSINTSSAVVFSALRQIATLQKPLGVHELHQLLHEPASSTHRALATLEDAQMAARFDAGRYGPGAMNHHLVRAMIRQFHIRKNGKKLLQQLAQLTQGAGTLHARLGWYALRIAWVEGQQESYLQLRIGEARPLHLPVSPKAMFSLLRNEEIEAYRAFMARRGQGIRTEEIDRSLGASLQAARRDGYVSGPDPYRAQRLWVAFPISDHRDRPIGSVSITFHESDVNRKSPLFGEARSLVERFQIAEREASKNRVEPYDHLDPDDILLNIPSRAEFGPG